MIGRADQGRRAPARLLYLAALMTGMRQGELLGLRWRDCRGSVFMTPQGGCCSGRREEKDLSGLVREAIDQLLAKKPR